MATPKKIKNKHGRKGGRGIRPWLLIPKILAVGCVLGGLVAMLVIASTPSNGSELILELILLRVVAPGVLVAMLCGVGLFAQHAVVFWRMRWLRVKLGVVMCLLATVFLLWERLQDVEPGQSEAIGWVVGIAIGLVVVLIVLGRMKPRLGMAVMKMGSSKIKEDSK